jgi:hypothetical protein
MQNDRANMRPPQTYRSFDNKGQEVAYLGEKLYYWLHVRPNRTNARRYIERAKRVEKEAGNMGIAIIWQSFLAVIAEHECRWKDAIRHRRRETRLIIQLYYSFTVEQSRDLRAWAVQGYRPRDLFVHIDRLKRSYAKAGEDGLVRTLSRLASNIEHAAAETGVDTL